jgi:hypothetical protein
MLNDNDAPPSEIKNFIRKLDSDFLSVAYLTCFVYLSPFYSRSTKIDLITIVTSPGGENIFIQKPDPDFLLVVC